jgi:hypothetical protein
MQIAQRLPPAALLACLATSLALLIAPLRGHIDDTDAQLYQVLVRQMARASSWLEPGLQPGSLYPFREHLPFGFWPSVAVVRLFGEQALPLPAIAFSLGTVLLVLLLGARLVSPRAGVAGALLLACTETFFVYGARPRLDPLLLFLATLAAAPALLGRLREGRGFALAATAGALATLVKGPFGLVPLAAAGVARAAFDACASTGPGAAEAGQAPNGHSSIGQAPAGARGLLTGLALVGALLVLAAVPAALFLAADRARGGTWWSGYVEGQILSSARGLRHDGETGMFFPFDSIKARFWPGLPLLLLGIVQALRLPLPVALRAAAEARPALRLLALASSLAVVALCLPVRKVWNHELVIYPLLALVAGAAADPLLRLIPGRAARRGLLMLGLVAWALSLAGFGARVLSPPCVGSREFAARLAGLGPGTPLLVVSPTTDWRTIASLAAEHGVSPWSVRALPAGRALPDSPAQPPGRAELAALGARSSARSARELEADQAQVAIALEPAAPAPPPWRIEGRARGWLLLSR